MLGRLSMTIEQCKDTLLTYAKSIFRRSCRQLYFRFIGLIISKYSGKSVVRATKIVVGSFDPSPDGQKWKRNMFAAPAGRCGWYGDISQE